MFFLVWFNQRRSVWLLVRYALLPSRLFLLHARCYRTGNIRVSHTCTNGRRPETFAPSPFPF